MTTNSHLTFPSQTLLIGHKLDGEVISQRPKDGYINATALCDACGKLLGNYLRNTQTKEFLKELERSMRIRIDLLIQKITTGPNNLRGTWVHPDVAIHLAQWLSPKFAVQVSNGLENGIQVRCPAICLFMLKDI